VGKIALAKLERFFGEAKSSRVEEIETKLLERSYDEDMVSRGLLLPAIHRLPLHFLVPNLQICPVLPQIPLKTVQEIRQSIPLKFQH
jgi:hypothetical protein